MALWKRVYILYKKAKNNDDFLKILRLNSSDYHEGHDEFIINNHDLHEEDVQDLVHLYLQNSLITTRLGCVESAFILKEKFDFFWDDHLHESCIKQGKDFRMKTNAGFYYQNDCDTTTVSVWWIERTLSAVKKSVLTSCLCVLHYDLTLWASMNLKRAFYNWGELPKLILQNSLEKKILYVGSGVKSIQHGYDRGVQKAWTFHVPHFELQTFATPQTTLGMPYPDSSIKETTEKLVEKITKDCANFDTVIFGCGAYGPPLTDILSEKLPGRNYIYLGSACYTMFGIYSHEMPIPDQETVKENWVEVLEEFDERLSGIDGGKYWKRRT